MTTIALTLSDVVYVCTDALARVPATLTPAATATMASAAAFSRSGVSTTN